MNDTIAGCHKSAVPVQHFIFCASILCVDAGAGFMTTYRREIDGLRAVAVVLVLAFHAYPRIVPGGFVGVDVFFVISGYLITGIIIQSDFSFEEFYARRARRLFPALIFVAIPSIGLAWFSLTPSSFEAFGKQIVAAAFFAPNLLFWSEAGYFDNSSITKPFLHLWSLGVEEQFYLVWPVLIFASVWFGARTLFVTLAVVTAAFLLHCWSLIYYDHTAAAFFSPFSRAWELSAGGLLAMLRTRSNRSAYATVFVIAGVSAVAFVSFYVRGDASWPDRMALLVVAGSMLVIHFGSASQFAQQTLGCRPMIFLGKISYPLYLWHWPILVFGFAIQNGEALTDLQRLLSLVVAFFLASLTHLAVEEPLKRNFRLLPVTIGATSMLAAVGLTGLSIFLSHGAPSRFPNVLQAALAYEHYDYATDGLLPGCWLNSEPISEISAKCLRINRGDGIVVWGDSHAARLAPGLREVFGTDRVSQLTRNSCPPLLGLGQPVADIKPEANIVCNESNAGILELIRKDMPRTLVLFGAWENYPTGKWKSVKSGSTTAEMLNDTIQKIRAAGIADIVVLGPAPRFNPTLPSQLWHIWRKTRFDALPERLTADRSTTYAMEHIIEDVVRANGAKYVSLVRLLCNEDGCLTKVPETSSDLITWDDSHLTTKGAIMVAHALQNRLTIR